MSGTCSKCNIDIKRNEKIKCCEGGCEGVYHIKCTDLNEAEYNLLQTKKCLKWFCSWCVANGGENNIKALIHKVINELTFWKQNTDDIRNKLEDLDSIKNKLSEIIDLKSNGAESQKTEQITQSYLFFRILGGFLTAQFRL